MLKTASIVVIGMVASIFSCEVQALPIAPAQAPAPEVLQVRGFCGLGFHRGPYGYCVRNGMGYVAPVVVAPPVVVVPRGCPWGYGYARAYGGCVPL